MSRNLILIQGRLHVISGERDDIIIVCAASSACAKIATEFTEGIFTVQDSVCRPYLCTSSLVID